MLKKFWINEKEVSYENGEKNIAYGVKCLDKTLSKEESKVFLKQAHEHGSAQFEDKDRHQFTLIYKGGTYFLVSRK